MIFSCQTTLKTKVVQPRNFCHPQSTWTPLRAAWRYYVQFGYWTTHSPFGRVPRALAQNLNCLRIQLIAWILVMPMNRISVLTASTVWCLGSRIALCMIGQAIRRRLNRNWRACGPEKNQSGLKRSAEYIQRNSLRILPASDRSGRCF
jgi:hypothetical protein